MTFNYVIHLQSEEKSLFAPFQFAIILIVCLVKNFNAGF